LRWCLKQEDLLGSLNAKELDAIQALVFGDHVYITGWCFGTNHQLSLGDIDVYIYMGMDQYLLIPFLGG